MTRGQVYERFGVRPLINARGPATRLSGAPVRPEVAVAMAEAAQVCVDMAALQAAASEAIARYTGAEAGIVTAGASAAMLLGAAACVTGLDPAAMARLPDLVGLKDEAVMARSQRNQYDHAIRAVGLRIVEAGLPDRVAGAGVRDTEAWEMAAAIGPRTALVVHVAQPWSRPSLEEVIEVARGHGVPVLVDAAAQLPPKANLRSFVEAGADLVAYSGSKAIGGPAATGILCGRKDLVAAAAWQMLDMDYPEGLFTPSGELLDPSALPGLPAHGIGRSAKVGKEQIIGLLTALELFVGEEEAAQAGLQASLLGEVGGDLAGLPAVRITLREGGGVPVLVLNFAELDRAREVMQELARGDPAVHLDPSELDTGRLLIDPSCLDPEQVAPLVSRLWQVCG